MIVRMKLLCDPALIPDTAVYFTQLFKRYGASRHRAHVLCIALESIMELRMSKANEDDPVLVLEAKQKKGELIVSVADKGLPYVLTENQKKILRTGVVDRFFFEQLGAEGQRISLCLKLKKTHVDPTVPEVKEEKLLDDNFSLRLTTDDDQDIIQVIQCIYTSYGYNYLHQEIYHTDLFREMLHGGKYISELAENDHHQVVGHVALDEHEWFPGIMELCNLVVKPISRGHGIAGKLVNSIIEVGDKKNLRGLFAMPAMFHPISQKLLTKHDFTPCGMYFHVLAADSSRQYGDGSSRLDAAFCVRSYDKQIEHVLHLPDECAEFVRGVFDREQLNYTMGTPAEVIPGETSLSYNIDTVSKVLEVKVDKVGDDLDERMATLQHQEQIETAEVIMVYLNANDPRCPVCYEFLRTFGFIFTGCLPGSESADYLMLQHLRGLPIVKENITAEPDYDEMLTELYAINGMA